MAIVNVEMREAIARWVLVAVPNVETSGFDQVDVDDLLGDGLDPLLAISAMRDALAQAKDRAPNLVGMVVFPLQPSDEFRRDCPEWPGLLHSYESLRSSQSVPGIYLLAQGHPIESENDENFVTPLVVPPEVGPLEGTYRTWRTAENQARGWEHARAIYLRSSG